MKNLRTVYLAIFIAAVVFSLFTMINVAPDAKVGKIGQWVFGFNLTQNVLIKVIGFFALVLYIFTPKTKK